MSETLAKSLTEHLSSPTDEWENVSSNRITETEKAQDMALKEDEFRTLIKKQGAAALNALMVTGDEKEFRGQRSAMETNLHNGPVAVERAGKEFDEAKKAELAEQNSYRPEWKNVSDERIDDPIKAAHMAAVENEWRDQIHQTAQEAKAISKSDNPLAPIAAQAITEPNRYDAMVNGPRAVEATGAAYDALHNPDVPASK